MAGDTRGAAAKNGQRGSTCVWCAQKLHKRRERKRRSKGEGRHEDPEAEAEQERALDAMVRACGRVP
jgi:hypothetical protein